MKETCLVVGDLMLDRYLYGSVSRISPEAPIPIVSIREETEMLGGAANVAANLKELGLQVVLCGVAGNDYEGEALCRLIQEKGISFQGIQCEKRTTVKTRIVGQAQQIVRIDKEDSLELDSEEELMLLEKLHAYVEQVDCIIISDYKKGVCTEKICQYLINEGHKLGCRVLVDPKQQDWMRYRNADLIKPNFGEFCAVTGKMLENTEENITLNCDEILRRYGLRNLLVTRSQHGMTLVGADGNVSSFPAAEKEVYDVSGAGDTVLAALAAGLCWKYGFEEAVKLANVAAGIAVGKRGTYVVGRQELLEEYRKTTEHKKSCVTIQQSASLSELSKKLEDWRRMQRRIVFTNGCFDILHRGHAEYLQKAKALGDVLIVGVNSDESVRRLKGDSRPVNAVQDRVCLLKAMACVDEVVIFEEDTPYELLQRVRPDVLAKGGDYKVEEIVGGEFAKEVCVLPFVEGYSTSETIKRMSGAEV